jgi:hypothetical protein
VHLALGEEGKTLGEEAPGMPLTGKMSSSSAKIRTLGEAFPECRPSTRGRFNTVNAVRFFFFEKSSSPSATLGEEFCYFLKRFAFFKKSSSSAYSRHSGKEEIKKQKKLQLVFFLHTK